MQACEHECPRNSNTRRSATGSGCAGQHRLGLIELALIEIDLAHRGQGTNITGSLLEDCLELDRGLVALSRNEVCLAERQPCGNVLRVNLEMAGKNCDGLSRLSVCQSGFGFREHAGSLRGPGPAGTWILRSGDCGQETQE